MLSTIINHIFLSIIFAVTSASVFSGTATTTKDATAAYHYEFEGEEVYSNGDVLNMVTMLGVAVVSKSLLSCKVKTTDTTLAAASGISYLGGEVYSFFAYEDIEKKIKAYSRDIDGNLIDSDKKALLALKSNYENIKDVATTKKYLQYAAAAGFATSAALAYYDAYELSELKESCSKSMQDTVSFCTEQAALNQATSSLDTACLSTLPNVIKEENLLDSILSTSEKKSSTVAKKEIEAQVDQSEVAMKSTCLSAPCASARGMISICDKYKKELKRTLGECTETDLKDPFFQSDNVTPVKPAASFWDLFFASAIAESKVLSVFGMGAVGIGVYQGMVSNQGTYLDKMVSKPFNRGVAFSAFAGLSYMAAKSSEDVIDGLQKNINRINKILAPMLKPGTAAIYTAKEVPATVYQDVIEIDLETPVDKVTIPTTKVYEAQKAADPKNIDILTNLGTGSSKTSAQLITEISDGISGKTNLSKATLDSARTLSEAQQAINDKLRSIQGKIGNKTKKGELRDALSLQKKAAGDLKEALNKSFSVIGADPQEAKEIFKDTPMMKDPGVKDYSVAITKLGGEAKNELVENYTNYLPVEPKKKTFGKVETVNSEDTLSRFQNSAVDVNEKDKSLWDIISFRYFRSAYPAFSDEQNGE